MLPTHIQWCFIKCEQCWLRVWQGFSTRVFTSDRQGSSPQVFKGLQHPPMLHLILWFVYIYMAPLSSEINKRGIRFIPYLDDCPLVAKSQKKHCLVMFKVVVNLLQEAGSLTNQAKSCLVPIQDLVLLGMRVRTDLGSVFGTPHIRKSPNCQSVSWNLLSLFSPSGSGVSQTVGPYGQLSFSDSIRPSQNVPVSDIQSVLMECNSIFSESSSDNSSSINALHGDSRRINLKGVSF